TGSIPVSPTTESLATAGETRLAQAFQPLSCDLCPIGLKKWAVKAVCAAVESSRRRPRPNDVQLRGCDFDGGRAVVEDLAVVTAFDGPVARAVAFDHPRVAAVSTFVARVVEYFVDDAAMGSAATAVRA